MTTPDPHPFTPDNTAAVVCVHGLHHNGKAWLFCGRTAEDAVHATDADRLAAALMENADSLPKAGCGRCGSPEPHGQCVPFFLAPPPAGTPTCDPPGAPSARDSTTHETEAQRRAAENTTKWGPEVTWATCADCDGKVVRGCTHYCPHTRSVVLIPEAVVPDQDADLEISDATLTAWANGTHTLGMVPRLISAVRDAREGLATARMQLDDADQRREDVIKELRRHVDAQERRAVRAEALAEERRDAMRVLREQRDQARAGNVADIRELQTKLVEAQGRIAPVFDRDRLNADCQAIGDQLDRIKATAYRQALADAATCHVRAAGKWAAEPITHPGRTLNLYAYTESARVLTAWADDPTRMDGPLRGAGRATDAPSPPSPPGPCCEAPTPARVAGIPFAPCLRCGEPCTEAEPEPPPEATVIAQFLAGLGMVSSLPGLNLGRASDLLGMLHDAGLIVTAEADGSEDPASHALRAAADEWDRLNAGPDFTEIEALVRDHYRPGLSLPSIWLRLRADAIEGN